jgi:cysteine desulfurase
MSDQKMKSYYCDYNATTPVAKEVWEAMLPFLRDHWGNPSSLHHLGRKPLKALRDSRTRIAELIQAADEKEIIFTSCGTESSSTAVRAALQANPGKKKMITSSVEHSCIGKLGKQLRKEGYEVIEVGVSQQGFLNIDEFQRSLDDQTAVVSFMMANNETGVLFPINEIGKMCREKGVLFHVDGVQALAKYNICVKDLPVDYMSMSAHKIYGPKGVGALYVRKDAPFQSFILGGSQERGRRAGTENVAGIVGFARACELAQSDFDSEIERLLNNRRLFEETVISQNMGVSVNGNIQRRIPTTSNLQFAGIDGEALMMALDQRGVCVSAGSACMSGSTEPSHVLKAMAFSDDEAQSSIRFSFGRYTTEQDIRDVCKILHETLQYFKQVGRRESTSPSQVNS